jgi:hypothetical protein
MIQQIDKKRNRTDDTHVYFTTRLTKEGVINDGFQSKDELEKMIPYLSGLPITMEHPPDEVAVYDAKKSLGHSANVKLKQYNGVWVAEGEVGIAKGNVELIKDIERGTTTDVSIGYSMNRIDEPGSYNDESYSHLRTNIMPFHLAILSQEPPACPGPVCGIGIDHQTDCENECDDCKNRKPLIYDNLFQTNSLKGEKVKNMTDNQPQKPEPTQILVHTMSVDSLAKENSGVAKLIEAGDELKQKLDCSNKKVDELTKERDSLMEYKVFVDELRKKETDALREKVREAKVFEETVIAEMGKDEMLRILKMRDSLVKSDNPAVPTIGGDADRLAEQRFTVGQMKGGKWTTGL